VKQLKIVLTIIACFTALSATAKQVGKKTETVTQPSPVQPNPPVNMNRPRPAPIQTIFDTMPTYSEILSLLKKKKPDSSDFTTLNNIKNEAEYQINFIRNKEADFRARIFNIKQPADMKTYTDIYNALKQRTPDSSDFTTLNNIIYEVEKQIKNIQVSVQQPQQKQAPQKGYTQILTQLQNIQPTQDDWDTLRAIKDEVIDQMGKAFNPELAKKYKGLDL
jgi:hypothetical protein